MQALQGCPHKIPGPHSDHHARAASELILPAVGCRCGRLLARCWNPAATAALAREVDAPALAGPAGLCNPPIGPALAWSVWPTSGPSAELNGPADLCDPAAVPTLACWVGTPFGGAVAELDGPAGFWNPAETAAFAWDTLGTWDWDCWGGPDVVVSGATSTLVVRRLVVPGWRPDRAVGAALVGAREGRASAATGSSLAFEEGLLVASAFTPGPLCAPRGLCHEVHSRRGVVCPDSPLMCSACTHKSSTLLMNFATFCPAKLWFWIKSCPAAMMSPWRHFDGGPHSCRVRVVSSAWRNSFCMRLTVSMSRPPPPSLYPTHHTALASGTCSYMQGSEAKIKSGAIIE